MHGPDVGQKSGCCKPPGGSLPTLSMQCFQWGPLQGSGDHGVPGATPAEFHLASCAAGITLPCLGRVGAAESLMGVVAASGLGHPHVEPPSSCAPGSQRHVGLSMSDMMMHGGQDIAGGGNWQPDGGRSQFSPQVWGGTTSSSCADGSKGGHQRLQDAGWPGGPAYRARLCARRRFHGRQHVPC